MWRGEFMSKNRKIALIIFFALSGLLMLHPMGRILMKFFIPMGINTIELIGFLCFLVIPFIVVLPWLKSKLKLIRQKQKHVRFIINTKKVAKENKQKPAFDKTQHLIAKFMLQLSLADKQNQLLPYFRNVIEIGEKEKQDKLVADFIIYYGELTLKFLESKKHLEQNNLSDKINYTKEGIEKSLQDMKRYCDNFVARMIEGNLADLNADITVLGQISQNQNLN